MKKLLIISLFAIGCNSNEEGTPQSMDSSAVKVDSLHETRGTPGPGGDNNGGTSGAGTITDTLNGQVDTADHRSKRNADSTGKP